MKPSLPILALCAACLSVITFALAQDNKSDKAPAKDKPDHPAKFTKFDAAQFIKDFDKNGDGYLSKDELPPSLREHFDAIDTNKDGKLSKEELERHQRRMIQRPNATEMLFLFIDTTPDDEFSQKQVQQAYDLLRKIDKNGDGKIDAKEFAAAREMCLKDRVEAMVKDRDKNGDGKISREEAKGMPKEEFDKMDLNKDGFLDRDELLKAALACGCDPADAAKESPKKEK